MLGFYNYTVILTYLGMLSGFAGITFAYQDNLHLALICLMIAGVCDMFDGKIASTMERTEAEKRFGIQIDSLSDLICFGALPALILYSISCSQKYCYYISAFYLLCALIRLAWFNVDEEKRQTEESGSREIYLGLPVTASALIIPLLFGIAQFRNWPIEKLAPMALLLISIAFLVPFPLKKPALMGKLGILLCGGIGFFLLIAGTRI